MCLQYVCCIKKTTLVLPAAQLPLVVPPLDVHSPVEKQVPDQIKTTCHIYIVLKNCISI